MSVFIDKLSQAIKDPVVEVGERLSIGQVEDAFETLFTYAVDGVAGAEDMEVVLAAGLTIVAALTAGGKLPCKPA